MNSTGEKIRIRSAMKMPDSFVFCLVFALLKLNKFIFCSQHDKQDMFDNHLQSTGYFSSSQFGILAQLRVSYQSVLFQPFDNTQR
jgi:hypothetical protein